MEMKEIRILPKVPCKDYHKVSIRARSIGLGVKGSMRTQIVYRLALKHLYRL